MEKRHGVVLAKSIPAKKYNIKTGESITEALQKCPHLKLVPPKILSLEQALDFIDTDELLEVTPQSLRIRKKILDPTLRKRAGFKK